MPRPTPHYPNYGTKTIDKAIAGNIEMLTHSQCCPRSPRQNLITGKEAGFFWWLAIFGGKVWRIDIPDIESRQ